MDVPVRNWMASAVLAAAVLAGSAETLSAQATPAPAAAQTPPPPAIVVYRKAFMNMNAQHMAALRALTSGEIQLPDNIRRHAAALQENAILMTKFVGQDWDFFPVGSLHAQSRATAKIWEEREEFAWRGQAFAETATALFEAVKRGASNEELRTAIGRVQTTCGGCHASMRGPAIAATN